MNKECQFETLAGEIVWGKVIGVPHPMKVLVEYTSKRGIKRDQIVDMDDIFEWKGL